MEGRLPTLRDSFRCNNTGGHPPACHWLRRNSRCAAASLANETSPGDSNPASEKATHASYEMYHDYRRFGAPPASQAHSHDQLSKMRVSQRLSRLVYPAQMQSWCPAYCRTEWFVFPTHLMKATQGCGGRTSLGIESSQWKSSPW